MSPRKRSAPIARMSSCTAFTVGSPRNVPILCWPGSTSHRTSTLAGNDLAMICHSIPEIENVTRILGALPRGQVDRALASVARFKEKLMPPADFSETAFRNIDSEIWDLRVAVLGEELASQRGPEDAKRSPVEMY